MRNPEITRTFKTTRVNLLCMDVVNKQPVEYEMTLPRTYKDDDAILKYISKNVTIENLKVVHVISSEVQLERYAQSEVDFIKYGHKVPLLKNAESVE